MRRCLAANSVQAGQPLVGHGVGPATGEALTLLLLSSPALEIALCMIDRLSLSMKHVFFFFCILKYFAIPQYCVESIVVL